MPAPPARSSAHSLLPLPLRRSLIFCGRLANPKLREKLNSDAPPEAEMQEKLEKELKKLRKRYGSKYFALRPVCIRNF